MRPRAVFRRCPGLAACPTTESRPPRPPDRTSATNVFEHAFGYVLDDLSAPEKATFLETLDAYRAAAPLGVPSRLASSLVVRVAVTYLDEQIFSQPFLKTWSASSTPAKGVAFGSSFQLGSRHPERRQAGLSGTRMRVVEYS
ncbi:MAG: DUF1722 domain-containing protein [Candidatus Bipolaricaulota bacterium]|nr:DUF1722 domain-containing protein [Candidatus Bipolaricaulota bacterium]